MLLIGLLGYGTNVAFLYFGGRSSMTLWFISPIPFILALEVLCSSHAYRRVTSRSDALSPWLLIGWVIALILTGCRFQWFWGTWWPFR